MSPLKTMQALVADNAMTGVEVRTVPFPTPGKNDLLVKVAYAAQNPVDWKHAEIFQTVPGARHGCDFAGTVVTAPEASRFKAGDRVAGFVYGGGTDRVGSFAEFMAVPADLVWAVPEKVSLVEAATFGVPFNTAVQALVQSQSQPFPVPPAAPRDEWFFISGGSSGVGLFAIQLAKLMGYRVVTLASSRNFELVKNYGADEVFDYRDAAVADKILAVTGGGVTCALDTVADEATHIFCTKVFAPGGGRLNTTLPPTEAAAAARPDVEIIFRLVFTLLGNAVEIGARDAPVPLPASAEDRAFYAGYVGKTSDLVGKHGIRAPPIDVIHEGLSAIPKGYADMKANKISGRRRVYSIGGEV